MHEPEHLVIRPPSEARSLLLRVVRGCNWNRCRFCGIYDLFETPYSTHNLDEVIKDIDALAAMYGDIFRTAFIGDANPLDLDTDFLVTVLTHLREKFPRVDRVTSYARASSLQKKSVEDLLAIHEAGLDRVHVGLESGSNKILKFQMKGTSQNQLIEAGKKAMASGMELSYYFLSGLGGQDLWEEHAIESATVFTEVKPHFIRVRRLFIHPMSKLMEKVRSGEFSQQIPEGTILELRLLLDNIDAQGTTFTCDHANNFLPIHGTLNAGKAEMLGMIDKFLALPQQRRMEHYNSIPSVI
jgi:radical SAM superfamily enzyme YgiQ (UPF0313 family)